MVEWLAGNRIRGTSTERTTGTGFNPVDAISGGWKELARTTLGSASHPITVSSLPDKRYYMVLAHNIAGGSINWNFRVGTGGTLDTGSNYSDRHSQNGAGDSTTAPANRWGDILANASKDRFTQLYIANKSGSEKLMTGHVADRGTSTGAGSAPERVEIVGKWTNTSLIDALSLQDDNSQNFGSGSEMVVLGWDPTDTHATNFWEELASVSGDASSTTMTTGTITAKKYLWYQMFIEDTQSLKMEFNGDGGLNYSRRYSIDGATDGTSTGVGYFGIQANTTSCFINGFIVNNSANEKLVIQHNVERGTAGAGTAPNRFEFVGKWANTSAQITRIDLDKAGSNFTANSIIKVWGSD
jgi:hypothetical protein